MLIGVAPAGFIGNNFQPFPQGFGQFGFRFRHCSFGTSGLWLGRADGSERSLSLRWFVRCHRLEGKLETIGHLAQASAVSEKRILVVDDDTSLIRLIGEALR